MCLLGLFGALFRVLPQEKPLIGAEQTTRSTGGFDKKYGYDSIPPDKQILKKGSN